MSTDTVNFILLISVIYNIVIFANGDILFKYNENVSNRTCIIRNSGLQGICIPFSKCKNAQMTFREHKIKPTNCYYNGIEAVVCCSDIFEKNDDHFNCRKSKIQCYKTPDQPGLFNIDCWEKACKKIVTNFEFDFKSCYLHFALHGVPTRIGDYPFMVALGFRQYDGNHSFNCGGFLVTRNFVITAAHCTNFGGDIPVVVRTGGIDLDNNTATNLDIPIKRMYIHPLYKSSEAYNDIAVIELARPSNDASKCISNKDLQNYTDERVVAVGYGQISFGGPTSNRLLEIDLVIVNNDECQKHYPINSFLPRGILSSQVCAIDKKTENTQDTCQGDSGGPLLTVFQFIPKLFVVTSFGNICGGSKTPGVYTRVEYFSDWLESIIWPNV